jgi:translation elongation factor EF-1beta
MEDNGNAFIVRLKVKTEETDPDLEQLKGEIKTAQKPLYDKAFV